MQFLLCAICRRCSVSCFVLPGLLVVNFSRFITSVWEGRELDILLWFARDFVASKDFPLPLGAWERLHYFIGAYPRPSV